MDMAMAECFRHRDSDDFHGCHGNDSDDFSAADEIGPSYLVWLTPGRAAIGKGAKRQQQDVAHTRPALAQALRPEAGRLAKVHRVAASPSARRSG